MMPGIATAFTIAGLSSLGLPATAGFVAEFLTFLGAWSSAHPWWLFPGVFGAFLTAIYVLRVTKQIFWGTQSPDPHFAHLPDARGPEWAALGILVFVLVLFGVAPNLAIGSIDTATVPRSASAGHHHRAGLADVVGGGRPMTFDIGMPLVPELALFVLAVLVLLIGLVKQGDPGRVIGWITFVGLLGTLGLTFVAQEGGSLFSGSFVNDSLAIFAKKLFLSSAALSVLGSLTLRQSSFNRRAAEYHFALLASVLGMLVLASARELILLFVSFELMSIPLYVLTGFVKREDVASEAALKFFLVGTASSAVIVYGMSFVFGVTGTTELSAIPAALAAGDPLMMLGMTLLLAGLGFKIAAFPFHMWAPDTYEAASTPFVAWLAVAPKAAGFIAIIRLYVEGVGAATLGLDAGRRRGGGDDDRHRQPDGDPAAQHQAAAGLLGHRAHRLHAGRPGRADEQRHRDGALLPGRLPVREHGRLLRRRGGRAVRAVRRHRRVSRPGAALAAAGAGDAGLPAVARRHSVRRRLLGEALRLPRRDQPGHVRPRLPRRDPDRRRALLLPARRQAHVHRSARSAPNPSPFRSCSAPRSSSASPASSASARIPARGSPPRSARPQAFSATQSPPKTTATHQPPKPVPTPKAKKKRFKKKKKKTTPQ